MNYKPSKELVKVATLLEKIDFLDKLITKDVSEYVLSIQAKTKQSRNHHRAKSDAAHNLLIDAARKYSNG